MARRRDTSRVTAPGTRPDDGSGSRGRAGGQPTELPSIRKRRPGLFWTVVVATFAMVGSLVIGFFQAIS